MEEIQIKGIETLSDAEKEALNGIIEKYKEKIKWKTKTDFSLKIIIKEYSYKKDDLNTKRKKYSINIKLAGQTQNFEASSEDWDFNTAVRKAFDKLEHEIEHRFHSSEQRSSGRNKE